MYILVLCITTYLKADHFTVGPKGSIVRAIKSTQTSVDPIQQAEEGDETSSTLEDALMSDPTAFFGSSIPSLPSRKPDKSVSSSSSRRRILEEQDDVAAIDTEGNEELKAGVDDNVEVVVEVEVEVETRVE